MDTSISIGLCLEFLLLLFVIWFSHGGDNKRSENCFLVPTWCILLLLLLKGFSYIQMMEAYNIFSDDLLLVGDARR